MKYFYVLSSIVNSKTFTVWEEEEESAKISYNKIILFLKYWWFEILYNFKRIYILYKDFKDNLILSLIKVYSFLFEGFWGKVSKVLLIFHCS